MKAEDTVMKKKWMNKQVQIDQDNLLLEQAEISFKAGIKEVFEWIMSHQDGMIAGQDMQLAAGNECKYGNTSHLLVRWLDWQSKLKEWGL